MVSIWYHFYNIYRMSVLTKNIWLGTISTNPWVSVNTIYIPVQYIPKSFIFSYMLLYYVFLQPKYFIWFMWYCNVWDTCESLLLYTCYISLRRGMNFVRVKSDPAVFLFFIFCSYEIRIRRDEVLQDVLLKDEYKIIAWYYENGHTVHSLHEK